MLADVSMLAFEDEKDLRVVRRHLDRLTWARMCHQLSPSQQAEYEGWCRRERQLLAAFVTGSPTAA